MNENLLKELKEKLEERKKSIESQLKGFAEKDKKIKGDWDTKYPRTDSGTGSAQLEDAADEVEEYSNLLPVEHSLELQLVDIDSALEKMNKGTYGKCEKCGKEISEERLKANSEAKTCNECPA
jgi:RNA polymerase-binding transcription factor DksA